MCCTHQLSHRSMHERRWIDIEPSEQNLASHDLSKKVINLLRYKNKMEQFNSGELNMIFEIYSHKDNIGLMNVGKLVWLQEEDPNEEFSTVLIICEQISISVLFKDTLDLLSLILLYRKMYSAWNMPSHLPHWMCVQSSLYQQWTGTWRSKFKQKTNSVLLAC